MHCMSLEGGSHLALKSYSDRQHAANQRFRWLTGTKRWRLRQLNNTKQHKICAMLIWGGDKTAVILQKEFLNKFSCMIYYCILFQISLCPIDSSKDSPVRCQAIICTNNGIVYWCIFVRLFPSNGEMLDSLTHSRISSVWYWIWTVIPSAKSELRSIQSTLWYFILHRWLC